MDFVDKLDEHGKGAWIGVMILSFILFWPAGLAILAAGTIIAAAAHTTAGVVARDRAAMSPSTSTVSTPE